MGAFCGGAGKVLDATVPPVGTQSPQAPMVPSKPRMRVMTAWVSFLFINSGSLFTRVATGAGQHAENKLKATTECPKHRFLHRSLPIPDAAVRPPNVGFQYPSYRLIVNADCQKKRYEEFIQTSTPGSPMNRAERMLSPRRCPPVAGMMKSFKATRSCRASVGFPMPTS